MSETIPKRGRPVGLKMLCGWGCGANLTAVEMRAHFTSCSKRGSATLIVSSEAVLADALANVRWFLRTGAEVVDALRDEWHDELHQEAPVANLGALVRAERIRRAKSMPAVTTEDDQQKYVLNMDGA